MANFDSNTGNITTSSGTVQIDAPNESGCYIILSGAAHAGITVNFEGTVDGTNWFAVAAYQINTNSTGAVNTVALASNSTTQYYAMVGGAKIFRVRSSAYTSGTLQVFLTIVIDADPILPSSASPAASSDALANPTVGQTGALQEQFNGTTWDRVRNNASNVTVDASAAKTVTVAGATATNFNAVGAFIQVNVTAVTGTTPTLTAAVQYSVDGTNFVLLDNTNAITASITATGQYVIKVYPGIPTVAAGSCNSPLPRVWRLLYTVGGTTPSFTLTSTVTYQN